ncbi:uncharacterized protein [Periplaneta americana]|uniref:uncharacterized protein n=1 Tax=Periplaneta americana TaxID=6978 RepID=UPI0037E96F52
MLLQDVVFLDSMMSFARERIPTRAVHATGSGAFGYFNVTQDITRYCKAKIFSSVGKRTRVAVRLSLAALDKGSPETVRDLHGFSVKFYTEDGIWDIVGFDTPVFFLRDAMLIPSLVHMILRNPVTNMKDNDMLWDFVTKVPEATYCVMTLLSDNGIPDGYRHMNGFAQNIFKMVNESGNAVYVKFHFLTDQGVKNLMSQEAEKMSVLDPDYYTRDLYNAIANGDYPSWTMYIQVMTFEEAEHFRWNPFDVTKIWPEDEYELIEVGKLVLDRNPSNYFADVEQIALNPGNLVPGIEPSPDKVLQGRLLAYTDSQRHRVGENYLQLPINCPFSDGVTNYQRDGPMAFYSQGSGPNYYPNSFNGPTPNPWGALSTFNVSGEVKRYDDSDDDNYSQPAMYWSSLSAEHQDRLVQTIALYLNRTLHSIQTGGQLIKTGYGTALFDVMDSLTVGHRGPMVMDAVYFDTMSHFNRERIPDRVIFARGSGAYGYFEVTEDISKYCRAEMFELGKKTKILVRFSAGSLDRGAQETVRAPVGFAVKFYSEDGIQDILASNIEVSAARDPLRFILTVSANGRNPATNLRDLTMKWDYYASNDESINAIMHLYSHRGIPDGWRGMPGYSQNTFKLVNAKGKAVYARFVFLPYGKSRYLSSETASKLRGTDPDYNTRDLYNAIARGNYPFWSFNIQVMTIEQAKRSKFNPFDVTKLWPENYYPLIKVGRFVLNQNPKNFFADIEQAAFNPAHMVPGIEPSPDKMLQGRMFAYGDSQRYRLGPNYMQLSVNCPCRGQHTRLTNYERDGAQLYYSQGGAPTYYPNSFGGPVNSPWGASSLYGVSGYVRRYNTTQDDNYYQATTFWKSLSADQKNELVENVKQEVVQLSSGKIKLMVAEMFSRVNMEELGSKIRKGMGLY